MCIALLPKLNLFEIEAIHITLTAQLDLVSMSGLLNIQKYME